MVMIDHFKHFNSCFCGDSIISASYKNKQKQSQCKQPKLKIFGKLQVNYLWRSAILLQLHGKNRQIYVIFILTSSSRATLKKRLRKYSEKPQKQLGKGALIISCTGSFRRFAKKPMWWILTSGFFVYFYFYLFFI